MSSCACLVKFVASCGKGAGAWYEVLGPAQEALLSGDDSAVLLRLLEELSRLANAL
jgi:hypothetical protein